MMKKKLLFINKSQFGYHTDYYKFCEHLRDQFDITFLCFDSGLKKLEIEGVVVKYVPHKGIKLLRGIRFVLLALLTIARFKGLIFIHYFENCQLLKQVYPRKKMILDIRTLTVGRTAYYRTKHNNKIKKATTYFDHVTIISEGLREKINLDKNKSSIVPLGADIISKGDKLFEKEIRLLYVGTLNGRKIHDTISGLDLFLKRKPEITNISYDIVGDGKELNILKNVVAKKRLVKNVNIHGRIPHFEIKPFFEKCNIGVSYVPATDYYEHQPATKTYEYILAGMTCIATNTYENRKVIIKGNGVLCEDNPESFANALEEVTERFKQYKSETIRDSLSEYTWENIVKRCLSPLLKKLYEENMRSGEFVS